MNTDTCRMKSVADEAAVRAGPPGAFAIVDVTDGADTFRRLWAHLPDGTVGGFNLEPAPSYLPAIWAWNGSEQKPTLKRQVKLIGRWCGQIRAGRMVSDPAPAALPQVAEHQLPLPNPVRAAVIKSVGRAF